MKSKQLVEILIVMIFIMVSLTMSILARWRQCPGEEDDKLLQMLEF